MNAILASRLAPFRHTSFRQFFLVQTLSLTGSWAADLARAWLILQMFGSAAALGGLLLCTALPGLFLILHGGVLVDRLDVRKLMMQTKLALGFISLALAALVEFGHIQYWHLLLFGFLEGMVNAFDAPAYQALTVRLVPKEDFQQALALNSTNFHGARMLGPAVAGILMAIHGPSLVFLLDSVTYFTMVAILRKIELRTIRSKASEWAGQWRALVDGLKYIARTPRLRYQILQMLFTIALMFPLVLVVFRTFIKAKFGLDAQEFGWVFTIPALGSMSGALSFAVIKPKNPIKALLAGVPGVTAAIFLVPFMPSALSAACLMGLSGFFMYLTLAALNVSLQLEIDDEYRGRISSVVGLFFVSIGPLMGWPLGMLADRVGFHLSIQLLTGIFIVLSGVLAVLHRYSLRGITK